MKPIRLFLKLSGVMVLFIAFQNCTAAKPVHFSEDLPSKSSPETDGNGHGYDGKIYLVLGDICPDSTHIHSKIVMKSVSTGDLVRDNCQDITPLPLTSADFQLDSSNPDLLTYNGQNFNTQVPFGAATVDISTATASIYGGDSYIWAHEFGVPADTATALTQSQLQLFEDGVAIGPAHSYHADIANLGMGRFSHWDNGSIQALYFSASDNSNPLTNGRVYSYKLY